MDEDVAVLVHDAVRSMRDADDGTAIAAVVRLRAGDPGEVVGLLSGQLATVAGRPEAPSIGLRDSAGRLPDDDTVADVLGCVAANDASRLGVLAGGSYVGLLVLLVGTLARLTPAVGHSDVPGDAEADDAGAFELATVRVVEIAAAGAPVTASERDARTQLEWGLDLLVRVIEPAVRRGKGPDYFAGRDASEGCSGPRSYVAAHRWFYAPEEAIRLQRTADGVLDVIRGHDRVAAARELGIDELPAYVR
mgnify:CR=1 FL=1